MSIMSDNIIMSEQPIAAPEQLDNQESSKKKQEAKRKKEYEANRKSLDELCTLYPELFNPSAPKPLQIGIHEAVAADGKLSKTRIRRALNLYVRMRKYVASIKEDADRITIDGSSTGKVTAEEAAHAKEKLLEIDKRRAKHKPQQKPKKPRKPAHAKSQGPSGDKSDKTPAKKPAPRTDKPKESSGPSFQDKLESLVNKRSN